MMRLSGRERKILLVGAAAIGAYLLCHYLVFPYWDRLAENRERIDIQTKRLLNYRRILKGQETAKTAMEEANRQLTSTEAGLLTSPSDALAAAEIQGLIKQISGTQGLNILRTDVLPVKVISPEYSKVSTRVEVGGPIDRLVSLLANFDSGEKILFVEELRISPTHINVIKEKSIRATLTVSAIKRAEQTQVPSSKKS